MLVNSKNEIRARVQQFVEQQMQTTMVRPSRLVPDHQRLWAAQTGRSLWKPSMWLLPSYQFLLIRVTESMYKHANMLQLYDIDVLSKHQVLKKLLFVNCCLTGFSLSQSALHPSLARAYLNTPFAVSPICCVGHSSPPGDILFTQSFDFKISAVFCSLQES